MPVPPKKLMGVPFVVIVALAALVASLLLIIFLHSQEPSPVVSITNGQVVLPTKSIWLVIGEHIATALFILGVWHTIDYVMIRKEFNSEIIEHFEESKTDLVRRIDEMNTNAVERFGEARRDLSGSVEGLKRHFATAKHDELFGLVSTHHDTNQYDLSPILRRSKDFIAVMADGYSWTSRHVEAFRDRFKNPELRTTVILVHPDSDQIQVISRKIGMSPEMYRQRIHSTIRQLRSLAGTHKHLRILGHSLISCHSLYIADQEAILSPYFLSTQRRIPPILVVRDAGEGSYYQKIVTDIDFLIKESLDIAQQEQAKLFGGPNGSAAEA